MLLHETTHFLDDEWLTLEAEILVRLEAHEEPELPLDSELASGAGPVEPDLSGPDLHDPQLVPLDDVQQLYPGALALLVEDLVDRRWRASAPPGSR